MTNKPVVRNPVYTSEKTIKAMQRRIRIMQLQQPILRPPKGSVTSHTVGVVHLLVENESWASDAEIPQYGVERGADITDHVQPKSRVLTLTGVMLTDDDSTAEEKMKQLEEYKDMGILIPYYGRSRGINFLIHKFTYQADNKIGNGYRFTIILEQTRFAEKAAVPRTNSLKDKVVGGLKQVKGNTSTQHTVKKGDTYADLAKKYGTTWQKLYELNKYPPTKIPVGVKLKLR